MSIGDETRLRARLGAALDEFDPGPLALDSVLRQGRATVIRRRVLAAVAVVLVAVAAITVPRLAHQIGQQTPIAPLHYDVTVTPPSRESNPHLIASGRLKTSLNNMRWSVSGVGNSQNFNIRWHTYAAWHKYVDGNLVTIGANGNGWEDSIGTLAFPKSPVEISDVAYSEPDLVAMIVRADVHHVVVSLSNGQTVTLRPVAVLGRAHPGFVAIAVPAETSIRFISAFGAKGEIGYTVPFGTAAPPPSHFNQGPAPDFEILRWLAPSQPALPRPATYEIGQGTLSGAPWSEYVHVGPWGACVSPPTGSIFCYPSDVTELTDGKPAKVLDSAYFESGPGWSAVVAQPSVSSIVLLERGGRTVRLKLYPVDGAKFGTIAMPANNNITGWRAYSVTGQLLASGTVN